jgi:hypothetical protein
MCLYTHFLYNVEKLVGQKTKLVQQEMSRANEIILRATSGRRAIGSSVLLWVIDVWRLGERLGGRLEAGKHGVTFVLFQEIV